MESRVSMTLMPKFSPTQVATTGPSALIIYTDDSSYQDYKILFTWLVPLSIAIGIALLLVPHAGEINESCGPSDVLAPSETTGRHFQWAQKLPLKKAVSNLPSFGLLAATIWSFGLLAILIIEPTPRLSIGLIVHLRSDPATKRERSLPAAIGCFALWMVARLEHRPFVLTRDSIFGQYREALSRKR